MNNYLYEHKLQMPKMNRDEYLNEIPDESPEEAFTYHEFKVIRESLKITKIQIFIIQSLPMTVQFMAMAKWLGNK